MEAVRQEPSLRDYGKVIVRRKWIVALAVITSVLTALIVSVLQTPIYESDSEVLIQPRGGGGVFEDQVASVNNRSIQTEIRVVEGEAVRARVQQNLGLADPPRKVEGSAIQDTDVIRLTIRDPNAANAQLLANAYAEAYIQVRREQSSAELTAAASEVRTAIDELQTELDELATFDPSRELLAAQLVSFKTTLDQLRVDTALQTGGAVIVKSGEFPASPVEPTPARSAALAGTVGLLLGLGMAFLVDYLDDKVRNADDLERLTDHPVLAVVPVDPPPDNRPIAISEPGHISSEAYRGLRTNVQFRRLDDALTVIQVTSSNAGEGKTTTASNLAVVLAQAGQRVALVDADLRRPRLHLVFGVAQSPGLTDLLLGAAPRDVVHHVEVAEGARISLYCSGVAPSNPSEILGGRRMRQLLDDMGGHYDYVVVDSAPVLPVSDSLAIAHGVDGVLFVVHAGHVTDSMVSGALERLGQVSAPVLGLALNQARNGAQDTEYSTAGYASAPGPQPVPEASDAPLTDAMS